MTTPADIISRALRDAGIVGKGQSPLAEDTNDAFNRMNMMISQWNVKRWLIYDMITTSVVSTGATSYTIGAGGNFNVARPNRLQSAYVRLLNAGAGLLVDVPLTIIDAQEDYDRITVKNLGTFPDYVFYKSEYPLGKLFFWPVPNASIYQMFVSTLHQIDRFTSLTQTINLPPEYEAALHYNLAVRLAAANRKPPNEVAVALARDSLEVLRKANMQLMNMVMPYELKTGLGYNIYSDRGMK